LISSQQKHHQAKSRQIRNPNELQRYPHCRIGKKTEGKRRTSQVVCWNFRGNMSAIEVGWNDS